MRCRWIIRDCIFQLSSGSAIRVQGPDWQAVPLQQGAFSTQVVVRDCVFIRCDQAITNWADWTSVTDSWITTSENMTDKAVFENHDRLFLTNILGTQSPNPAASSHSFNHHALATPASG